MRVLLPLRKVSANKQASNSSLSDLEDEDHRDLESIEGSVTEAEQSQQFAVTFPNSSHSTEFCQDPRPGAPPCHQKTETGPCSPRNRQEKYFSEGNYQSIRPKNTVSFQYSERASGKKSSLPGKRKPQLDEAETDYNRLGRKRPALDKKPAARDLESMVAGRRSWIQRHNGDRRDSPEMLTDDIMENNPASARGDLPTDDDVDFDFFMALKKQGLEIREQDGDGNCLFRAVSLQVYGDPSMHSEVRKQCMDFMERDEAHFSQFVTGEPFNQYIQRKRQDGVHGNNPEIQAISELFNRPVEVFCPDNGATPLNIFHAEYKTDDAPIRLSYHDGNHYNAVVDPLVPTAGLGLGLPGLQPGLADKLQMAKAVKESDAAADEMEYEKALKNSEDDELQRAIKESKLSAEHMHSNEALALSDMDATYFELEQAALEQSLNAYPSFEQGKKQQASSSRRRKQGRNSPTGHSSSSNDYAVNPSPSHAVASLPEDSSDSNEARIPPPVAAAVASVASAASIPGAADNADDSVSASASIDQYPQTVHELVMNGFELRKVVRAYELIGDNFDDLLSFLMTNNNR